MMASDELEAVMLTVADRFGWDWRLIESTPISKLNKWYDGAVKLYEHERGLSGKQKDNER